MQLFIVTTDNVCNSRRHCPKSLLPMCCMQDILATEPQGNNLVNDTHMSVENVAPNEEAFYRQSSGDVQDAPPSHVVCIAVPCPHCQQCTATHLAAMC